MRKTIQPAKMALSRVGSGIWKMMSKQYQASVAACGPASQPFAATRARGRPIDAHTAPDRARAPPTPATAARPATTLSPDTRDGGAPRDDPLSRSLNQYGLKYDDVKIEQDADYAKALGRISDEEVQARARRMKRAFDISFKKKSLPADLQRLQAPLAPYAAPLIDEAKARRVERELLNTY